MPLILLLEHRMCCQSLESSVCCAMKSGVAVFFYHVLSYPYPHWLLLPAGPNLNQTDHPSVDAHFPESLSLIFPIF